LRDVSQRADQKLREAAEFTASLYLTAWQNSADLELPDFQEENRRITDGPAGGLSPADPAE
jgi:hypothetical protein